MLAVGFEALLIGEKYYFWRFWYCYILSLALTEALVAKKHTNRIAERIFSHQAHLFAYKEIMLTFQEESSIYVACAAVVFKFFF